MFQIKLKNDILINVIYKAESIGYYFVIQVDIDDHYLSNSDLKSSNVTDILKEILKKKGITIDESSSN